MEQRIGSSSQPLDAAAVNPAYIPGLTSPVSAEAGRATEPGKRDEPEKADEVEDTAAEADGPADDSTDDSTGESGGSEKPEASEEGSEAGSETGSEEDPADEASEDPAQESAEEPDEESGSVDGPVFEAADRRARIVADASGVRLRLDDQECEFRWDEIGALETETPRFGKRFTVTVHTPDRRWYPIEIEAASRASFQEWESGLDEVLDAYFEDGEAHEPEPEDEVAQEEAAEDEAPEKSAP